MGLEFTVVAGKAVFTDTKTGQPIPYQGRDGKTMQLPNARADIITRYDPLSKDDIQIQIAQLNKRRVDIVSDANNQLAQIDEQIALLKSADEALPVGDVQPVG